MEIESKILNVDLLTDVFGRFPSFHDSEVLSVTLHRGEKGESYPSLSSSIHVFEMTPEISGDGEFVLKNHVVVAFRFTNVRDLRIDDFNHQNVLQNLKIDLVYDERTSKERIVVNLKGIHGVDAKFSCDSISVESVEPFD